MGDFRPVSCQFYLSSQFFKINLTFSKVKGTAVALFADYQMIKQL